MGEILLLSTTSELNGWDIEKYIRIISENAVEGTGLLGDMVAEFLDVTGGRSGKYQEYLTKLNEEVLNKLKDEAKSVKGANAVVGIKIEHNEITGKGKQMFMVTATGTAVFIKRKNENIRELKNMIEDLIVESLAYDKITEFKLKKIKINRLLETISENTNIKKELGISLFKYYKIIGMYAKAEDVLFSLMDKKEDIDCGSLKNKGIEFYKDLLNKSDDELQNGNLPRNEVEDSMREFNMKYSQM